MKSHQRLSLWVDVLLDVEEDNIIQRNMLTFSQEES